MSAVVSLSPDIAGRMLAELCARNQTAELVFKVAEKPEIRAKVRFLDLTESEIWVDYPTVNGRRIAIHNEVAIRLFFCLEDDFYSFVARPLGPTSWSSRGAVEVAALRLEIPEDIERNQRRSCYRLSMLQHPSALVRFMVLPYECPAEPESITATLRNISETGVGIATPPEVAADLRIGQLCRAVIQLPGQDDIIEIPGKIGWIQKHQNGQQSLLGLAWQWDASGLEAHVLQCRLARFIMSAQLDVLRRRRMNREYGNRSRSPGGAAEMRGTNVVCD
ncbi:MAG: hypothetical protein GXY44_13070 [Phycisphaerales bacterium]|nr:hypothetical protein [Phycisphaerales bacterium]